MLMWLFVSCNLLGCRTYLLTDLGFTGILLFCSLISELLEQNSTKIGYILGVSPKSRVSPLPTNHNNKAPFFTGFCNLMAALMAYIFVTKHDIDNCADALNMNTA